MSRWEPNARARLQEAAMALYGERGYEQTTAAEIAKRAGLTERTFFRHYADKREVLFWGAGGLQELFVTEVAGAPDAAAPIDAIAAALAVVGASFEDHRENSKRRQAIIAANAELQERELIKLATLASAVAGALRGRGVPDTTAGLIAEITIAVFKLSFERWIKDGNKTPMTRLIEESLAELKSVTAT